MTNKLINKPTVGGAVFDNNLFYIERNVDHDLYERLKSNKLSCILQSRQTGKTSLLHRICNRLSEDGIKSVCISFSGSTDVEDAQKETWYNDQMDIIKRGLESEIDLKKFREKNKSLSSLRRFDKFIQDILLRDVEQSIVIFIDEIDSVLSLPFPTDDYFTFIRNCYDKRASDPNYRRLTFCLLGVASPNDLISDKRRTPFNSGTLITLSPFPTDMDNDESHKTMKPFLDYVKDIDVLKEILDWTGGQPFLTQKLCELVVKERESKSFTTVKKVVDIKIINNWHSQDTPQHLRTIQTHFDEKIKNKLLAFRSLDLYKKILENQSLNADNSQEEIELKLSGLVLQQENILKPYNPIYTSIFDINWVEVQKRKIRVFSNELDLWKHEDPRKKQLHLLYREKCEDAKQWREELKQDGGYIDEYETNFIDQSSNFWEAIQRAFPQGYDHELMINSMNDWTSGFDDFNNRILQIAGNDHSYLTKGDYLRTLVEENIEDFKKYEKFRQDRDQLLNQDDSFELISLFEKIAQKEPILFDENNPQHRKLKGMCFIILDKERNLRILNKIYEKILDQNWIKGVIAELRPYTNAFRDWQDLDPQKSSYSLKTLKNNALKLALEWLGKKPTPKLEEGEIEFVITSLVVEVWTTASPSVQFEAISLITTFRPLLQEKDNYSDFLLQEILQWTTSQTPLLGKLLEWVKESEIPIENSRKYLEFLVGSNIKNWSCQNLFNFALAPYSSSPERDREIFIAFDQYFYFLGEMNQPQIKETLQEWRRTVDKYQQSKENDFQESVLNFFKVKIARISFMTQQRAEQQKLDVLLDEAVTTSKGHLKSILIFELDNGLPLYHNKQLKDDDPALYQALFAEGGDAVGEAIEGFDSLNEIQEALDSFGDVTKFGNLIYSIFRLKEGTMMVYFLNLTISLAICFIAPDGVNLGLVVTRSQAKIKGIKEELEDLGF